MSPSWVALLLQLVIALSNTYSFCCGEMASSSSAGLPGNDSNFYTIRMGAKKPKVRVNILYLTLDMNAPMLHHSTFAEHLNFSSSNENNDTQYENTYKGSVPWLGNAKLENVEVFVTLRNTKYDVNFNLQLTFATLLDLLVTKPAESCMNELHRTVTNSTSTNRNNAPVGPVIHMIVGPGFSGEVKAISQLTTFYNLVMISGTASSPALADRSRYPYFFRTIQSNADGPDVIANVLTYLGYTQLNAFYQDEAVFTDLREMLEPNLRARGIKVENSFVFNLHDNRTYYHIADKFGYTAHSRVWFVQIHTSQYELLCALYQYGQVRGTTHLAILFGPASDTKWFMPPPPGPGYSKYLYTNDCTVEQIKDVVRGAIHIANGNADYADRPADLGGPRPSEFKADMQAAFVQAGKSAELFYTHLYFLFDALTSASLALDRAEYALQKKFNSSLAYFHYNDSTAAQTIFQKVSNLSFQGLTGKIEFANTGDRVNGGWLLRQFQGSNLVDVARYEAKNSTSYNLTFQGSLIFSTDDGKPPPQFGANKTWATFTNITLIVLAVAIVLVGVPVVFVYVRRGMRDVALRAALSNSGHWLIDQSMLAPYSGGTGSKSLHSMFSGATDSSVSLSSKGSMSLRPLSHGSTHGGHNNSSRGFRRPFLSYKYERSPVCLFPLQLEEQYTTALISMARKTNSADKVMGMIDREFVRHVLEIQACSPHEHLSRFIGIVQMTLSTMVKSKSNAMHVIMAGTTKGTLCEFLAYANDELELDETCSFSLLRDLQKGLFEVQRRLGHHGRLSSAVCLVDSRLALRLSDYGFGQCREASFFSQDTKSYENWLWTAPEVLQLLLPPAQDKVDIETNEKVYVHGDEDEDENETPTSVHVLLKSIPVTGWCKNDTYSFGIIMAEVFSHSASPFEAQLEIMSALALLKKITTEPSTVQQACVRPTLKTFRIASDITELTLNCCSADVSVRPTLVDIGNALRTMMKARKLSDNFTEMLMNRLENYASNLASLVEQRTEALAEEESKVRRLLYQILPPSVADALKNGQSVPPQTYESVSIYFSDIVGFTTISVQSTPLEVIDLLNDLYNTFDQIISKFDVYKVETIGDAYMVVSGLPSPNGLEHARYIVRLSLALIEHVTTKFKIRHRPNERLLLRIGIHTGPCAAGVVGFVMPRYCLFGDTVNTASRMESTGEPLRIHASEASAQVLQELQDQSSHYCVTGVPEYALEVRGDIEVKGKGIMRTYWVSKP